MEKIKSYLLSAKLSMRSVREYSYWINVFEKSHPADRSWNSILKFKERCLNEYSPSTQKVVFTALNHYARHRGFNKCLALPHTTQTFKREPISSTEMGALVNNMVGENYNIALRNRAILLILWGTGLRIGELLNLKWAHIGPTHICVTSKGNRTRYVPYKSGLFREIEGVYKSEYVICSTKGTKLSYSAVHRFFTALNKPNFSPHCLRHSYATRLLHSGVPINYVSELLGHSSVDTTLIYLHYKSGDVVRELELKDWNNEL